MFIQIVAEKPMKSSSTVSFLYSAQSFQTCPHDVVGICRGGSYNISLHKYSCMADFKTFFGHFQVYTWFLSTITSSRVFLLDCHPNYMSARGNQLQAKIIYFFLISIYCWANVTIVKILLSTCIIQKAAFLNVLNSKSC